MKIEKTKLDGVKILTPTYYEDYRGYFVESYSAKTFAEYGITDKFIQDGHTLSFRRGTLRGIHFQDNPKAQTKLFRCTKGVFYDVVVDLRKKSSTYKQYISIIISAENRKQIYIPKGFGHACVSLTDNSEGQYKYDEFYCPKSDRAIRWDDPELDIDWGIEDILISEKDMKAPFLKDSDVNF